MRRPFFCRFRPLLDHLEERQLTALAEAVDELEPAKYDSEYPARVEFYRKVKGLALELRFGAAVAILSALFMAPLAALLCVLVLRVLRERGVANRRAAVLALLFGLATPVLYRSAILSGNLVLTALVFSSALCLATLRIPGKKISSRRALLAGILAGYGDIRGLRSGRSIGIFVPVRMAAWWRGPGSSH